MTACSTCSDENVKIEHDFDCTLSNTIVQKDTVYTISFSPDNTKVAVGGQANTAVIYDTATAKEITSFHRDGFVYALEFSSDSKKLAVAGSDRKAIVYHISSQEAIQIFRRTRSVWAVAFSHDSKKLAVGGNDNMAAVYHVESGELLHLFHRSGLVRAVAFSRDGNKLVVGGFDKKARIYNLKDKDIRIFKRGKDVNTIAISPDDTKLAVGGKDKKVILYDFATGNVLKTFRLDNWVWSVAFSPNGSKIITGDHGGNFIVHDVVTGDVLKSFQRNCVIRSVAFCSDGEKVAVGGGDSKVEIYDFPKEESENHKVEVCYDVTSISSKRQSSDVKSGSLKDISICFIRKDDNADIDGTKATVFIKTDLQNTTKLSDALKQVPESSGLFHIDPEAIENEYVLRVIVKDNFILQADQCSITIEELRDRFDLDFAFLIGIRLDQKPSFQNAALPF